MWKAYTDIKFTSSRRIKNDLAAKTKQDPGGREGVHRRAGHRLGRVRHRGADPHRPGVRGLRAELHRLAGSEGPRRGPARHVPRRAREPRLPARGEGDRGAREGARRRPTSCRSTTSGRSRRRTRSTSTARAPTRKVREVPFRGSEFFATARCEKDGAARRGRAALPSAASRAAPTTGSRQAASAPTDATSSDRRGPGEAP